MQQNAEQIDLFALNQTIDTSPLTVKSDTLVVDAIALMMGWAEYSNSELLYEFNSNLSNLSNLLEKNNFNLEREDYVLVVEGLSLVGILTQTDVFKLTISGRNLSEIRISEVMKREFVKLKESPEQDIFTVRSLMREHRVSHLPIVDRQDRLLGIVTQSSLLKVLDRLEKFAVIDTVKNQVENQIEKQRNQLRDIKHGTDSNLEKQICMFSPVNNNCEPEIQDRCHIKIQSNFQANVLAQVSDAVIAIDHEHRITYLNKRAEQLYGVKENELLGRHLEEAYKYRSPERADLQLAHDTLPVKGWWQGENIHIKHNGEEIYVDLSISFLKNHNGENIGWFSVIRDITKRKQAEEKLRQSEERFRQLVTHAPVGIFQANSEGDCIFVNQRWVEIAEMSREEALGKGWANAIHPDDREHVFAQWYDATTTKHKVAMEYRLRTPQGKVNWVFGSATAITNEAGKIIGYLGTLTDISQLKQAEEKLHRIEGLLQEAQRVAKMGSWSWDLTTNDKWWSQEFYRLTNSKQDSPIPDLETTHQFIHPEDRERINQITKTAIEEGIPYETEFRFLHPDGSTGHAFSCGRVERDRQGQIIRFYGISKDISEYKQVESELRKSKELYRNLAQKLHSITSNAPICIYELDREGRIVFANRAYEHMNQEELLDTKLIDWFPKDQRSTIESAIEKVFRTEKVQEIEYSIPNSQGEIQFYTTKIAPNRAEGKATTAVLIDSNITEIKRAQADLQESEERFRTMADTAPVMIWVTDTEKHCTYFNSCWLELTGQTLEHEMGHGWIQGIHPGDRQKSLDTYFTSFDARQSFSMEYRLLAHDGEYRWILDRGTPRFNPNGSFAGYIGSCVDITDRKRAEEKIAEQAELLDVTTDAILLRKFSGEILYYNQAAESMYGWTSSEAIGKMTNEFLYKENSPELKEALKKVTENNSWQGELCQVTKEGKEIIVASRWTLVRDKAGNPESILTVDTDITEKKQLEAQFLRAQRLDSLGTLASGVAHDLNNILTPILGVAQLLPIKVNNLDGNSMQMLETLENSAKRGANLVKQILSFARGQETKRTLVQIKHLLKDIEQFVKETFPKSIHIEKDIPQDLWIVSADPTQLHQVLINLIVNARDAMPNGGTLSISAQNISIDENYTKMNIEAKVGSYVVVTITDTGVGIPPENIDRIFDPFFTTKEVGKGTGLGLSTVLGIVKNHDGFLEISSKVEKGSEFKVYLPSREGIVSQITQNAELLPASGELILLVDDEVSICEIIKTTLETYNFRVLTAQDGIEGISLYAIHKKEISVVLIDMMMPLMDGKTAIRTIQKMNSQAKIIGMSGLASMENLTQNVETPVQRFLAKPFTAQELLNSLTSVL